MDVLGQGVHPLSQRVDLLREIGVLLEQISLGLRELLAMRRRCHLIRLIGSRLRLLGDDDQRTGDERHGREDEVEQDERPQWTSLAARRFSASFERTVSEANLPFMVATGVQP
jgi:hypothetical protein